MTKFTWLARLQRLHFWDKLILLLGLVAFHWFSITSHTMAEFFFRDGWHGWNLVDLGVLLATGAVTWSVFVTFARRYHSHMRVVDTSSTKFCENLILFLSSFKLDAPVHKESIIDGQPVREDSEEWAAFQKTVNEISGDIAAKSTLEAFGKLSWRMPLEAIAHHARLARSSGRHLRSIAVITSSDNPNPSSLDGSFRQLDFFTQTLKRLLPESREIDVIAVVNGGCNFQEPEAISEAVLRALGLFEKGARPGRAIIDVTGGTKHCSIVAGVLSLESGRFFEYATTTGVKSWDIRYIPPHDLRPEPTD